MFKVALFKLQASCASSPLRDMNLEDLDDGGVGCVADGRLQLYFSCNCWWHRMPVWFHRPHHALPGPFTTPGQLNLHQCMLPMRQQGLLSPGHQPVARAVPSCRPAARRHHQPGKHSVHNEAAQVPSDPAEQQDALPWSAAEPERPSAAQPGLLPPQQQQRQRRRQKTNAQQQQQQQPPMQKQVQQDARPTPKQRLTGAADLPQDSAHRSRNNSGSSSSKPSAPGQPDKSTTWRRGGQQSRTAASAAAGPTPYEEAQQRVREVLAAADLHNPAAAAEQLPDTVNDLTIALQLMATAPRPTQQAAYRQHDAAVQQLAAAVVDKYKKLLLRLVPFDPQQQQQQQAGQQSTQQQQQQLAASLAALPATKLAAAAFSLGVLRLYDKPLVQAIEDASLQLLHRDAFKPNQLGQLVQGFVYLDHQLSPAWHSSFLECTRKHLDSLQGAQLASVAVWLLGYGLCSSSHAAAASTLGLMLRPADPTLRGLEPAAPAAVSSAALGSAAAAAAGVQPDAAWVQQYLAAAASQVGRLKPLQLVQVVQACAGLRLQQQQQGADTAAAGADTAAAAGNDSIPVCVDGMAAIRQRGAAASAFARSGAHTGVGRQERQPQQQQQQQGRSRPRNGTEAGSGWRSDGNSTHSSRWSSSAASDSGWVLALVSAVQQQLPELTMTHLAAVLPPLLLLTQRPWPQQLLQPLLLQVKVQLPSSVGRDLVAVLQSVAHLAGPEALAAEQEWCDAVLMQLHAQLPTLGPSDLAGAVHAVALLHVRPYKAWTYELCHRLRVDVSAMSAAEVVAAVQGLAAVGVQLDPEVLHAFVLQINRWMGSLTAEQLGGLVAALRAMYPRALPGRTVQQLVEEMQRRQQFLVLQARKGQQSLF